jgi:hypothetical protein
MAFTNEPGGTKKLKALIEIKSKGKTKADRRKELADFHKGLKALAKKYLGKATVEKNA